MPTPAEIIKMVSALENDTLQTDYRNETVIPYLNMALNDLQEEFELNDILVTYETSAILIIPAGMIAVGFSTTPALPAALIEIKKLWESDTGQEAWSQLSPRSFISPNLQGIAPVAKFGIWAWNGNEIRLPESSQINDLKLDYISSIFSEVTMQTVDTDLGIKLKNCKSYLGYRTGAHCAMWIGENPERAAALSIEADHSLSKSLGIAIKNKQSIAIRRRPFRASYKLRRRLA